MVNLTNAWLFKFHAIHYETLRSDKHHAVSLIKEYVE